ncbi:MAG: DUF1285 domain-containing protein [Alphaproteobacteria bacterium]|nr:DUF1285 domain-containing protein [Alphaproteobacteria bacterium]
MTDELAQSGIESLAIAGLARGVPAAGGAREPTEICGDFDLRIARDGTWFYRGSPIGRAALVKLFARVLRRDADGSYWLVTPVEKGRVTVDDAPFVAVDFDALDSGAAQRLVFRTNLDETVEAGPDRPIRVELGKDDEPAPYVLVRPGLEARIARAAFYRLVEIAQADGDSLGVWSGGTFFRLGRAA